MKFALILSSALLLATVANAAVGSRELERDSKYKSYEKSSYVETEKHEQIPNNKSDILSRDRSPYKVSVHDEHKIKNSKSDYLVR